MQPYARLFVKCSLSICVRTTHQMPLTTHAEEGLARGTEKFTNNLEYEAVFLC